MGFQTLFFLSHINTICIDSITENNNNEIEKKNQQEAIDFGCKHEICIEIQIGWILFVGHILYEIMHIQD